MLFSNEIIIIIYITDLITGMQEALASIKKDYGEYNLLNTSTFKLRGNAVKITSERYTSYYQCWHVDPIESHDEVSTIYIHCMEELY